MGTRPVAEGAGRPAEQFGNRPAASVPVTVLVTR